MEEKDQGHIDQSIAASNSNGQIQPQNVSIYKWKFSLWSDLPFGCKFIFVLSVIMSLASLFYKNYQEKLIFWGSKIVYESQYHRFLLSYLLDASAQFTVISLIAKLFWLSFLFSKEQRKLSTVHFIIDTFLQNLILNLILYAFSSILYDSLGVIPYNYLVLSHGINPLIMIFIWSEVARYTNHRIDFWFLPFLIPFKYLPGIMLKYRLAQGLDYFWADLFGCLVGYLQFMVFRKRFTRLPFAVYQKIESIIPGFIKNSKNFIKISTVELDLKFQSFNGGNISNLSRVSAGGGVQIIDKIDQTQDSNNKSYDFKQRQKNYGESKEEVQASDTKRDEAQVDDNMHRTEHQLAEIKLNHYDVKDEVIPQDHSAMRLGDSKYGGEMDDEEIESEPEDEAPGKKLFG